MTTTNRKYKERLLLFLLTREECKGDLLDLYNALNGTSYDNAEDLVINSIEDVVYMGYKNDLSCIIDGRMSLIEHQSTINPNMPLRGFLYFGKLYDKYVNENNCNLYSSKLVKLPTPKYFVLYNGLRVVEDYTVLRLSDAFMHADNSGGYEWTAIMLNINHGHNKELLEGCKVLQEYAFFVAKVREYHQQKLVIEDAVDMAVEYCIKHNILKSFLVGHRAEVIGMCITEYDEAKTMQQFKDEVEAERARADAIEQRAKQEVEQARKDAEQAKVEAEQRAKQEVEQAKQATRLMVLRNLLDLVQENYIPAEVGAQKAGLSLEAFEQALEEYKNSKN